MRMMGVWIGSGEEVENFGVICGNVISFSRGKDEGRFGVGGSGGCNQKLRRGAGFYARI